MMNPWGVGGGGRRRTIVMPALVVALAMLDLYFSSPTAAFVLTPRHEAAVAGLRRHRVAIHRSSFALRAESDIQQTTPSASSSSKKSSRGPRPPTEAPEPDLFDYFDPLLSPHAYPNGIIPPSMNHELAESNEAGDDQKEEAEAEPAPVPAVASSTTPAPSTSSPAVRVPPAAPSRSSASEATNPLRMDRLQFLGVSHPESKRYKKEDYDQVKLDNLNFLGVGTGQSSWPRDEIGLPVVDTYTSVFDPTVSPHKYPHGTPTEVLSTRNDEPIVADDDASNVDSQAPSAPSSIVGILLIDHGSKNDSSNQRLHDMASWYQECVQSVAVEAAHMEIASPSIKEGMAKLLERGAEEIVCHPYFLGSGRHVSEDIPRLIEEAMDELNVEVPVRTTAHVGSDMSMMLEAIHMLVKQSSTLLTQQPSSSRADRS